MKIIQNTKLSIVDHGVEVPFTLADLIATALNVTPERGFLPAIHHARERVRAALRASDGATIALEDADFETARAAVSACPYTRPEGLNDLYAAFGL